MRRVRVIPVLTLDNEKLVKTVRFKNPNYIGDPINAVRLFNDKEVDEIILLDISATKQNRKPNFKRIEEICSEAFMPFAYGGGISNIKQIDTLFKIGLEKVILNTILSKNINLIKVAANKYGSQSIVASIDIKKNIFGKYKAYSVSGKNKVKYSIEDYLKKITEAGIGEVFVNSIDKDGTFNDYDYSIIKMISEICHVPVTVCGGANSLSSFKDAIEAGASAVAAGSFFIYKGKTKGVLINYPSKESLIQEVFT